MVWEGCGNLSFDCVYSIQTLFAAFVVKSQHSTECTFYSKQPLPRVFCALPPVLPTWCDKTVAIWMSWLCWFNPDSLRSFCHKQVNIPLTLRSTLSSLFLAFSVLFLHPCLHGVTKLRQCGFLGCVDSIQTLFAVIVITSQHSTDSTFYSKQPLPRVFCALPPALPTWCDKTVAIWMSWLCWFNPDSLRSFCHEKKWKRLK